jgi:hypothetical protein
MTVADRRIEAIPSAADAESRIVANDSGPSGAAPAQLPRGLRNRNGTNVIYDARIPWEGQIGRDGALAVFDTHENGLRAGAINLLKDRKTGGQRSIEEIADLQDPTLKLADPAAFRNYQIKIGGALGTSDFKQPIDLYGGDNLERVMGAVIEFENANQQPYGPDMLREAAQTGREYSRAMRHPGFGR